MRPASCPTGPESLRFARISAADQVLLPCVLAIGERLVHPESYLAWAFGSVGYYTWSFQISLFPIAVPAPSYCPPPLTLWLGLTSVSYSTVYTRKFKWTLLSFLLWLTSLSPFLTSLWPWRICLVLFDLLHGSHICNLPQFPKWLNFIPCGKKCTDLWTVTAEFGSKLMSLMMCGLSRFTLQLCLVSHTIRATSPCPFQTVTKTYLHLEVTQMKLVPKWKQKPSFSSWLCMLRRGRESRKGSVWEVEVLWIEQTGADNLSNKKGRIPRRQNRLF